MLIVVGAAGIDLTAEIEYVEHGPVWPVDL